MAKRKEHIIVDGIECKECSKCKKNVPIALFNKGDNADGKANKCKECERAIKREKQEVDKKNQICKICNTAKQSIHFDINGRTKELRQFCKECAKKDHGTQKICTKCVSLKEKTLFNSDKKSSDGLHSNCKQCYNESKKGKYGDYQQKFREGNVEKKKELNAADYLKRKAKITEEK